MNFDVDKAKGLQPTLACNPLIFRLIFGATAGTTFSYDMTVKNLRIPTKIPTKRNVTPCFARTTVAPRKPASGPILDSLGIGT